MNSPSTRTREYVSYTANTDVNQNWVHRIHRTCVQVLLNSFQINPNTTEWRTSHLACISGHCALQQNTHNHLDLLSPVGIANLGADSCKPMQGSQHGVHMGNFIFPESQISKAQLFAEGRSEIIPPSSHRSLHVSHPGMHMGNFTFPESQISGPRLSKKGGVKILPIRLL